MTETSIEKREKRAKSISAMGLVRREVDKFVVSTPSLRGKQTSYEVWRNGAGKIRCNCLEFEEEIQKDTTFRCEHILAVKYALFAKNAEQAQEKQMPKFDDLSKELRGVIAEINEVERGVYFRKDLQGTFAPIDAEVMREATVRLRQVLELLKAGKLI